MLAASVKESAAKVFDRSVAADYTLSTASSWPPSAPSWPRMARLPELAAVTGLAAGEWR